jgi:B9 domain-containing protein 1
MASSYDARPSAESSSNLLKSTSEQLLASSSSELRSKPSGVGERNISDVGLSSSNGHLQMNNHRPSSTSTRSNQYRSSSSSQSTTFFVMITGQIESAISSTTSLNDQLYCRYSFSYGPDWEVVHGVSMGLSQIGRRGMMPRNTGGSAYGGGHDDRANAIVWNFPIEISFQSTNPHGWPRLVVSVYGLDFMGRDVVRGYASLLLPARPGGHARYLKIYRPVSGSVFGRVVNWLMGTSPEYYDSKMVARGEGRAVTRVVSGDRTVKVNLMVTVKDFPTFGYVSSAP